MRCRCYNWPRGEYKKDAHQEKNANSGKYHLRGREYLFHLYQSADVGQSLRLDAYQANTFSKGVTKGIEDVYSWIKPLGPSIIAMSLISLDLLLKDVENGGGRVADLELGGEWMGK